jgi:hypothetical protein
MIGQRLERHVAAHVFKIDPDPAPVRHGQQHQFLRMTQMEA